MKNIIKNSKHQAQDKIISILKTKSKVLKVQANQPT